MLTCLPLWAILITQCGQSWAFYTQLTELPTYMAQILHFDIQSVSIQNGSTEKLNIHSNFLDFRMLYFQPFHILLAGGLVFLLVFSQIGY